MSVLRRIGGALDVVFSVRGIPTWLAGGLGGLALMDAAHRSEDPAYVGFLAALVIVALLVTGGVRIRDAVLPVTEALGAAGGALLAIAFGLGFTDERYMKAPSTSQLLLVVTSVTVALVSARLRIAREAKQTEREFHARLLKIEQTQDTILRHLAAGQVSTSASTDGEPKVSSRALTWLRMRLARAR